MPESKIPGPYHNLHEMDRFLGSGKYSGENWPVGLDGNVFPYMLEWHKLDLGSI